MSSELPRPGSPMNAELQTATAQLQFRTSSVVELPLPHPHQATGAEAAPIAAPVEAPNFHEFSCPACNAALAIANENVGEAIDCSGCGIAVVSPDPLRGQPAILFHELLARMGIAPAAAEETPSSTPNRQIAEFKLRSVAEPEQHGAVEEATVPDPMAWLDSAPEPAVSTREPLWSTNEPLNTQAAQEIVSEKVPVTDPAQSIPNPAASESAPSPSASTRFRTPVELTPPQKGRRRRDPRTTPLRIAQPPKQQRSAIPGPFFTSTEITAAAVAVVSVGAISYALFFSPQNEEDKVPAPQPKTVVVTKPGAETPETADSLATRPSSPLPNGFEIDDQSIERLLHEQPDQLKEENSSAKETQLAKPPNEKILNFEKSRDALRAFCAARTPEDRLQFVLNPDLHEEDVHRYHEEHGPACFQLRELIHGQTALSKEDGRYWSSFLVQTNKNPRGFNVTMRETDSGPRLSWPAFVQHHDGTFETFLEKQPSDPVVFCAKISRGYSVDPNAPDPKKFHCFRVRGSESPRGRAKAYIDRKSYLGEQLERNVDWDSEVPITVELQWNKDASETDLPPTLFIREVLEYHW